MKSTANPDGASHSKLTQAGKGSEAQSASAWTRRLCSDTQRDEALLQQALQAFAQGDAAYALVLSETVCRRLPSLGLAAILRARILQAHWPALQLEAWRKAFAAEPDFPDLQLACAEQLAGAGQQDEARRLLLCCLPQAMRANAAQAHLQLLRKLGQSYAAVCWREGDVLHARASILQDGYCLPPLRIQNHTQSMEVAWPQDGQIRIPLSALPPGDPVYALNLAGQSLSGSPLAFAPLLPGVMQGPDKKRRAAKAALGPRSKMFKRPLRILLPVHAGVEQVRACLESLYACAPLAAASFSIWIAADAVHEAGLHAYLQQEATACRIRLLHNPRNLGFLENVNRALQTMQEEYGAELGDVLMLNADTRVAGDALLRLRQSLHSAGDIGAVTPWSNNGEISSFPWLAHSVAEPDAAQLDALQQAAASLPDTLYPLPAACGFCIMYKQEAILDVGGLDGSLLQRGYGEEVDWCMRARRAGWRIMLCPRAFVAHAGGVSFGIEKSVRVRQNKLALQGRWPDYWNEWRRFLRHDPLSTVRQALFDALQAWPQANDWLQAQIQQAGRAHGAIAPAGASSLRWLAVWLRPHEVQWEAQVLALAHALGAYPEWRLLVFGEAEENLWRSGVALILPPQAHSSLLKPADCMRLLNCHALLHAPAPAAPALHGAMPDWDGEVLCPAPQHSALQILQALKIAPSRRRKKERAA
ncbi:glycosyltransferase [Massilia sp. W12]|uniref:glycosyltransferase family 2 protein n=1 Tax=Massilia sp. W12 TaxID=3126507 RepID=UPI0030CD12A9